MQRRGFSLIDQKLSKLLGLNFNDFRIFWDICTAQKDHTYIVTLWGLRMWTNMLGQRCEKDVVGRRCEKDVVRRTLWERRCEKYVVRKSLWEIYFFWPSSFYWQIFVIKNVLQRLGALHLWCLCFFLRWPEFIHYKCASRFGIWLYKISELFSHFRCFYCL